MSGSFFGKLFKGLGLTGGTTLPGADIPTVPLPSSARRAIPKYFAALASLRADLPRDIERYISEGDNPSLLLTLQQQRTREHWARRPRSYPIRDETGLLSNIVDWPPQRLFRAGQILANLEPITYDWGFFGTKKSPDWLRHIVSNWLGQSRKNQPLTPLLALCEQERLGVAAALDIIFSKDASDYRLANSSARFAGVQAWLTTEHDAIVAALPELAAEIRAELMAAIGRLGLHSVYLDTLVDTAASPTKTVRTAARQALTGADRSALTAAIEARFATAAPTQRAELVEVAAGALGPAAQPLLLRLREGETVAKVLAAFERTAGVTGAAADAASAVSTGAPAVPDGRDGYLAVDGSRVELPPLPPPSGPTPLDREALRLLEAVAEEFNQILKAGASEPSAKDRWHWTRQYSPKGPRDIAAIAKLAEADWRISSNQPAVHWLRHHTLSQPGMTRFFADPRVTDWHVVRLAVALTGGHMEGLASDWNGPAVVAIRERILANIDVRQLVDLWQRAGGEDYIATHLRYRWARKLTDIGVPIWPALCLRFAMLDEAMGMVPQSATEPMRIGQALELLALFPKLPERYRARLMMLANDSARRVRDAARALLHSTPGIGDSIARLLTDGRQDVRAQAAQWLAQRGERDQIAPLRAALTKDRSDVARAAIITALERLGDDVSDVFDASAMIAEAKTGLARTKVKGIDWLPLDHLPTLHWADGSPVDPLLPRWWLVLAAKLKQPGGNALIDLWLDRLAPGDAHKLGWLVLTGWIDEDTRSPTEEEANAYAAAHIDATLAANIANVKRWPQTADYYITDRDKLFAQLKRQQTSIYLGSASDSKGVLALASRVNGADAAQRVRPFLKDHGARVSQAKALLEMMANIGTSSALQVVLSVADRFKQKSVQAHAAALIDGVAERNGWTAAQLADRTIPTGGLDADGTLDLDCGNERTYQLRFDAEDNLVLTNPDGKEVKALPSVRIDEEKPLIDAAKKLLTNARKEVKQVIAAQTDRLREAMCLERRWPREDWQSYVAGHPVVGRLATRLIWFGLADDGSVLASFRPLGDGSYTDAADNDVDLAAFTSIRLVHASQLDAAAIAAWRTHLADYAVLPPFDQINRDLPVLPDHMGEYRSITDREGWMIESFKLRGTATKQGYNRGPPGDGGWFMTYERPYREAGIVAEIEFTGSPLPEENIPTALTSLCFRRHTERGHGGGQLLLKDVPSVLLAESWQDLHDIAAKGSGFDAEWKKKASY